MCQCGLQLRHPCKLHFPVTLKPMTTQLVCTEAYISDDASPAAWPTRAIRPSTTITADVGHRVLDNMVRLFNIPGIAAVAYSSCPPHGWFFVFEVYTSRQACIEAAKCIEDIMINSCRNVSLISAIPSRLNKCPDNIIRALLPYTVGTNPTAIIIDLRVLLGPHTIKYIPPSVHTYLPYRTLSESI